MRAYNIVNCCNVKQRAEKTLRTWQKYIWLATLENMAEVHLASYTDLKPEILVDVPINIPMVQPDLCAMLDSARLLLDLMQYLM